jgi:hypothetical protein
MNLESLQREMAAAVMQPLTQEENMREQAGDGRAMTTVAESFIAPNSRLSAFERLEIYNRQYWYRVLDALIEDFRALRAVVGGSAFQAMSIAYLTAHPSRSFTMRNLGSKLPEWLAANRQFTGRRHRLAMDVARIEWAFVEAWDGADYPPLTIDQIGTLDGGSRLALQPHLRLIALDYPADDLVLALHDREKRGTSEAGHMRDEGSEEAEGGNPDAPAKLPRLRARPTWLAAHRVDLSVYYRRLQREEFLTLGAIRQGLGLNEAIEAGFQDSPAPASRRPRMVGEWFSNWAELGWICAPELESLVED